MRNIYIYIYIHIYRYVRMLRYGKHACTYLLTYVADHRFTRVFAVEKVGTKKT